MGILSHCQSRVKVESRPTLGPSGTEVQDRTQAVLDRRSGTLSWGTAGTYLQREYREPWKLELY